LLIAYLHRSSKITISRRSKKTVEIKLFPNFFLVDGRNHMNNYGSRSRRPKKYGSKPNAIPEIIQGENCHVDPTASVMLKFQPAD
jgi:hypothetical protein